MSAQLLQSCQTLCNPRNWSLPGSSDHGVLQARILEWIAMPSSRESSQLRDWTRGSCGFWDSCIAGGFFTHWDTWKPLRKTSITDNVGKMAMVIICHPSVARHLNLLWHLRSSPAHELCRSRVCQPLEKLKMRDQLTFPTSFTAKMQAHEPSCAKETQ